jgi:2',3'-cyclic-nucleotide 2'-phosphodiesterase (5'-nucleotidase family)
VLALLATPALAATPITILFEGDNGGEVAPCGCHANPTGGLPKRKTVLDAAHGPNVLVLDAGNALFRNAGNSSPDDQVRARFVLEQMGKLGTRAMAVGVRDLSAGLDFLLGEAKKGPVKLLSCNLQRGGKPVFEASTIVEVGGLKVAIIGVSAPGPIVIGAPDVAAAGTVEAVRGALKTLGKHDLTLVLAASNYADSLELAQQLKGQVDFVVQSGEFRGTQPPQRVESSDTFVFASGQKGQALGKLTFDRGKGRGHGPVSDLTAAESDRQQLEFVKGQVATLEGRLKAAKDPKAKADLERTMQSIRERQAALTKTVSLPPGARTMKLEWVVLNSSVADDPALKAEVLKIEPTYASN